jgi:hypothetical protein
MNRSWLGKHPAVQKRAQEDAKSYLVRALKSSLFLGASRTFRWRLKNLLVTSKRKISKEEVIVTEVTIKCIPNAKLLITE